VEHNAYTGIEFEPSAQLVWNPSARQSVWASVARAIRQPSWFDAISLTLDSGGSALLQQDGQAVKAERMLDFEVGYRTQATKRLSLDFSAFRSRYRGVQSWDSQTPQLAPEPAAPDLVIPSQVRNLAYANTYGGEVFAKWNLTRRWQISPGFGFLQMKIGPEPSSRDTFGQGSVGYSPRQQAQLRSELDLPHGVEWDTSAHFVGAMRIGPVPSYTRLDTRLGWRVKESLEFSVAGQNLLTPRHIEFWDGNQVHVTEVQRSIVGSLTWRF
jgi:iron complex outermembrane receptor protein